MLARLYLFPERDQLVSKGAKMLSEVASRQASSEITLFERYRARVYVNARIEQFTHLVHTEQGLIQRGAPQDPPLTGIPP